MTTVETIGRIRRAHFVQKLSVREIARRLHVSRKTVRKAIERRIEQANRQIAAIDREIARTVARGATAAQLASLRASRQHWIDVRDQAITELHSL